MLNFIFKKKRLKSEFFAVGFHGDKYLINVVEHLISKGVTQFIETGSNVGSTLAYTAKRFPNVQCYSCEPDTLAFKETVKNTQNMPNVSVFQELSQDFLDKILRGGESDSFNQKTLFWLDAHGYGYEWPLKKEINFIFKHYPNAYILIDDFKVPHLEVFGYDVYKEQICSFDFIRNDIPDVPFELYYPNYTEKTSPHHPLRGWGLIVIGESDTFNEATHSNTIVNYRTIQL